MNAPIALARRLAHALWYRRVRASLEREDACALHGFDLVILPGVLHPVHFASSRFLADHLLGLDLQGKRVADLGTGSGLLALLSARAGARVTAIDISPVAARCAAENVRRNGLQDRVNVVESDQFAEVAKGPRFDLVVTNPPFYARPAVTSSDRAFAAGAGNEFFGRLAAALPTRLAEQGALLMLQSSDADFSPLAKTFAAHGYAGRVVREWRGLFETLTIREFRATST